MKFGQNVFRTGDRVMQIKNDYQLEFRSFADSSIGKTLDPMVSFSKEELESGKPVRKGKGVFNGEVGLITSVEKDSKRVTVCYDEERWVTYDYDKLDEIELAYAVTVHKSQGGEFPVVIIPSTWFPPVLATRALIYTAITRGKEKVIICGKPEYLNGRVDNDRKSARNSGLKDRLIQMYQKF